LKAKQLLGDIMRKAAKITTVAAAAVLLLSFADAIVTANRSRYEASRLLEVVRGLHPGFTTEVQAQEALKPFSAYGEKYKSQQSAVTPDGITYELYNVPSSIAPVIDPIRLFPFRILYTWTRFSADFRFNNGYLSEINVVEMQEDHPGYPHPNTATVRMISSKLAPPHSPDFAGYSEFSTSTGGLDQKGNLTDFTCCYRRRIEMDERATADQVAHALNFRLSCISSFVRCKNDREILP
jgi:hypothetical protein